MKRSTRTMLALLTAGLLLTASAAIADSGKVLFDQHCAICHPNGTNIINPAKPLDRETLKANGITSPGDIIALMRQPGPGMTPFGPELISDAEAEEIAEYILKTF